MNEYVLKISGPKEQGPVVTAPSLEEAKIAFAMAILSPFGDKGGANVVGRIEVEEDL
jgi:hypothetical protein